MSFTCRSAIVYSATCWLSQNSEKVETLVSFRCECIRCCAQERSSEMCTTRNLKLSTPSAAVLPMKAVPCPFSLPFLQSTDSSLVLQMLRAKLLFCQHPARFFFLPQVIFIYPCFSFKGRRGCNYIPQ